MGQLLLRDGVYKTRVYLGQQLGQFWDTQTIIDDLNFAAQELCSEAQHLETLYQTTYPKGTEELALPTWVDKVLGVGVFSGQFFQLQDLSDSSDVQVASRVPGIPIGFYTKTGVNVLSPQGIPGNPTNDIVSVAVTSAPDTNDVVTALGLWPLPASDTHTSVWCTRFHPTMTGATDVCYIPSRFIETWVSYAVTRGKEKEGMLDEAAYWETKYQTLKQKFIDYWVLRKQSKSMPTYGGDAWPTLTRGSSSVIFIAQNPGIVGR